MSSLADREKIQSTDLSQQGEVESFDIGEVYRSGYDGLFARLDDGSLAALRAYNEGGTPQIDVYMMTEQGVTEHILPSVISVNEVKPDSSADVPGLYRESAGAGDESLPWVPAHFVVCVPVRAKNGVQFELQVKNI